MHLVYDARHLCLPYSGLCRYAASLLEAILELPANDRPARLSVLVTPDVSGNGVHDALMARLAETPGAVQVVVDESPFGNPLQRRSVAQIRALSPDHYFYPHYDVPLGLRLPITFVIHDLMPIRLPGYIRRHVWVKQLYFRMRAMSSLHRAHCCITVSEVTRQDVLDSFGQRFSDRTVAVHSGIPKRLLDASYPPREGRFLLYVGDRRPHKNLPRILDIFEALVRDHDYDGTLVMAGPRSNHGFDPEDHAAVRGLSVVFPGPISDAELEAHYACAEAHFLISDYEGFGLPVIEAARHGTKTIVSDLGALPEIAPKGSCVLPSAESAQAAATRVATYLAVSDHPDGPTVEAQYQWFKTARAILDRITYESTDLTDIKR